MAEKCGEAPTPEHLEADALLGSSSGSMGFDMSPLRLYTPNTQTLQFIGDYCGPREPFGTIGTQWCFSDGSGLGSH